MNFFRAGFSEKSIRIFFREKFWGLRMESIRNFLILRLESSVSRNIRNFFGGWFFYFFELGLKSAPGNPIYHYSHHRAWHDKLIILWTLYRQVKIFLRNQLCHFTIYFMLMVFFCNFTFFQAHFLMDSSLH